MPAGSGSASGEGRGSVPGSPPGEGPRPYAAVDIDGVLADVRHRLHHVRDRPKDWAAFFAAAPEDPPLVEGLAIAHRLAEDHDIVYVTGRPEHCRRDTEDWLTRHGLPPGEVVMRSPGDRRPARAVKPDLLRRLAARQPVAVLVDDDPAAVEAVRAAGFPVFQADWMGEAPTLFEAQEQEGRT